MTTRNATLGSFLTGLLALAGVHAACTRNDSLPVSTTADAATEAGKDAGRDSGIVDARATLLDGGFVTDPALWRAVPNDVGCELYEGRWQADPFPKREWSSCGPGCRVGDMLLPIETMGGVRLNFSTGGFIKGETYLALALGFTTPAYIQQIVRMSDEQTVAAVEVRGDFNRCSLAGQAGDAVALVSIAAFGDGGDARWSFGRVALEPNRPASWSAWAYGAGYSVRRFDFDDAYGMTFAGGVVGLRSPPNDADFVFPDAGFASIFSTAARSGMFAVSRWGAQRGVIQRIDADAGVSELVGLAGANAVSLAADDTRVAWISASGDPAAALDGTYGRTQIAWALRNGTSIGAVVDGPVLADHPSTDYGSLRIGPDHAASVGCEPQSPSTPDPTCTLYVVQFSTKKIYAIPHRPGANTFRDVLAVSDREVIVAETDYPLRAPFLDRRLVRLDLSSLGALGW